MKIHKKKGRKQTAIILFCLYFKIVKYCITAKITVIGACHYSCNEMKMVYTIFISFLSPSMVNENLKNTLSYCSFTVFPRNIRQVLNIDTNKQSW